MKPAYSFAQLKKWWLNPITKLSAEIEGHPLGGGMLKLEPREAIRLVLPRTKLDLKGQDLNELEDARSVMRQWRHYE
jgi:hypothetical protein